MVIVPPDQPTAILSLTPLEPQSRSGDKPVKFQVVLSPNGTAVLKGLRPSAGLSHENNVRIVGVQHTYPILPSVHAHTAAVVVG